MGKPGRKKGVKNKNITKIIKIHQEKMRAKLKKI